MTCPSCHGDNCELMSVVHARRRTAAPEAVPPQKPQGAYHLGVSALLCAVPGIVVSGWWLAGTAVLGLASLTSHTVERRHHARALRDWSRTCTCLDCGASWQGSDLERQVRPADAATDSQAFPDSLQHS
ncbi:hypothetical protein WG922_04970 [Ramlibacter sp. AN1015]|uniref:hypothetical protein n=1 Tax=Ramlibacter sp. AN1015 TaxID=3133428 RepID=UPI0030BB5795